ncbi:hypothetical protein L2E82_16139 [Cichorium intybus]|uniref:Uncharacterized protein n=1 Tax=Cichorium intybus TaxID=13427 RepID=A0ACB9F481_CICIN|nr:hypothetical protein L2E82_16139 [Cichorium intybus]
MNLYVYNHSYQFTFSRKFDSASVITLRAEWLFFTSLSFFAFAFAVTRIMAFIRERSFSDFFWEKDMTFPERGSKLEGQREAVNDEWKVYENPTMLYEVMLSPSEIFHKAAMPSSEMFEEVVQPSEMIHKAAMPPSCVEEAIEVLFDCDREQSGGDKKQGRRWWRVLTVLVTVIVVSTVGVSSYINSNEDEGFLIPT